MTSSDFEEEKDNKRATSCFQPIGQRDLSVGSASRIPSNLIECAICYKMIAKPIFEKHEKMCSDAKKKESYLRYQQEQITGKMNDVLGQSHSKAGKELYLKKMQTQLDSLSGQGSS